MAFSAFLDGKRAECKELVNELGRTFSYVSILGADTAETMIYADKKMVADTFYCGERWRVSANLLYKKDCYLVMSELKDDFYREF